MSKPILLLLLVIFAVQSFCAGTLQTTLKNPSVKLRQPLKLVPSLKVTLANRLDLYLVPNNTVPIFILDLFIKTGLYNEPRGMDGLSSFVGALITEGTDKYSGKEISERIDFIGGSINVDVSQDYTHIHCQSLIEHQDICISLVSDIVKNSNFPEKEIEKIRKRFLEQLIVASSSPMITGITKFMKILFQTHPYYKVMPAIQALQSIRRADLVSYYQTYYRPNNAFMVLTGDIQAHSLLPRIRQNFSAWPARKLPPLKLPGLPKPSPTRIYVMDRPNSVQSTVFIGSLGMAISNPRYFPFMIANEILGGGVNSRLFLNIREKLGYTYGIYSKIDARKYGGTVFISTNVKTDKTLATIRETLRELARFSKNGATLEELNDAINYKKGIFSLSMETPGNIAALVAYQILYGFPGDYWDKYVHSLSTVSLKEVQIIAKNLFAPTGLTIVVVGNLEKLRGLHVLGDLYLFDRQGQLLKKLPKK